MARARAKDGSQSDSAVVFLDVSTEVFRPVLYVSNLHTPDGKPPSLKAISTRSGISLGDILAANPELEGIDPEASLPPETTLHLPPPPPGSAAAIPTPRPREHAPTAPGGGAPGGGTSGGTGPSGPSSPPRPSPPTPPEALMVTMTCTEATLTWRNVSGSDVSYYLYAIIPGPLTSMVTIAGPLPASTNTHIYRLPEFGTYYFMVGARRGTEEAFTRPEVAHTDASCLPPRTPGSTDLVLTIAAIETDNTFESLHCFAVIFSAPSPWHRIPAGDFNGLAPSSGHIYNMNSLPSRGRYLMNFQNPSQPVEFRLECFGRNPPRADFIGRVFASHPRADWNGMVRTATSTLGENGNYRLYYCLGPAATPCNVPGSTSAPAPLWLTDPFLPPPTNVHLDRNFDLCMDIPNDRDRGICALVGAFTGGYASVLWDWNGSPHYRDADLTGYHVVLRSMNRQTGTTTVNGEWDVTRRLDGNLGRVIADRANRDICGVTYRYYVSAVARDRRSVESTAVEIVTPDCFEPVDVNITFQDVHVGDFVDDSGDLDFSARDTQVETFGLIRAWVGTHGMQRWLIPPVDTEQGTTSTVSGLFGGVVTTSLPVTSRYQTVSIYFHLRDYDNWTNARNDPDYCSVFWELPGRTTSDWLTVRDTLPGSFDDNSEAGCQVTVHVEGRRH
jgi:hypothetical protein